MYSRSIQILLAVWAAFVVSNFAQGERLSPLATGFARFLVHSKPEVYGSNPLTWADRWWETSEYSEKEIQAALKEVEDAYPEEIATLRKVGREHREKTLGPIENQAGIYWKKNAPDDPTPEILKNLHLFIQSQRASALGKPTEIQLDVMARQRTEADPRLPPEKLLSMDHWKLHPEILQAYQRNRRKAEEEEQYTKDALSSAEEAFQRWKQEQKEYLRGLLLENVRYQLQILADDFPYRPGDPKRVFTPAELRGANITVGDESRSLGENFDSDLLINGKKATLTTFGPLWMTFTEHSSRPSFINRSRMGYGAASQSVENDADLHFLEALTEYNRKLAEVSDHIESLKFDTRIERLQQHVQSILAGAELNQESSFSKTTLSRKVHGPPGTSDLLTDLVWAKMKNDPNLFLRNDSNYLAGHSDFHEFLQQRRVPRTWGKNLRSFLTAALLTGGITLGHFVDEIRESPQFKAFVEKAQAVGKAIDEKLDEILPESWRSGSYHARKEEERQQAEEERRKQPPEIPKSMEATKDAEEPEKAHNKYTPEELQKLSEEKAYEIEIVGSYSEGKIPETFRVGYLKDVKEQRSVPVPPPQYRPEDRDGYQLKNGDNKLMIPTDGIVLLPRADGNFPKTITIYTLEHDGNWTRLRQPETFLTEHGTMYVKLPKEKNGYPVKTKLFYADSELTEQTASHPLLFDLDPAKLKEVNEEIRSSGGLKVAEAIDALLHRREQSGRPISMVDIQDAYRAGTRYSFQEGEVDDKFGEDDFRRNASFLDSEGYYANQCDGSTDHLVTFVRRFFRGSDPTVHIARKRVMKRNKNELFLSKGAYHAVADVWVGDDRRKLTLDATSGTSDPRDEKAKRAVPEFLKERDEEELNKKKEPPALVEKDEEDPQKKPAAVEDKKEPTKTSDHPANEQPEETPSTEEEPKRQESVHEEEKHQEKKPVPSVHDNPTPPSLSPGPDRSFWERLLEVWRSNYWYHRRRNHLEHIDEDEEAKQMLADLEGIIDKLRGDESDAEIDELLRQEKMRQEQEQADETERKRQEGLKAERDAAERKRIANLKPLAPESIVKVVNARKALEAETIRVSRNHQRDPDLPHLRALSIAYAAEDVLMTGKGWTVLAGRISEFLERPVTISSPADVPGLMDEVKNKAAERLKADAAAIVGRRGRGPFTVVHSPSLRGRTDDALDRVKEHAWTSENTLGNPASSKDYAGCDTALQELSGNRYRLPE